MMLARCGLVITRSFLNRPCSRIWPSSSVICGATLENIVGLRGNVLAVSYWQYRLAVSHWRCRLAVSLWPGRTGRVGLEGSCELSPVEYYLAALALAHRLEGGHVVGRIKPVRDHR